MIKITVTIVAALILAGCVSHDVPMFPIEGPFSEITPKPQLVAVAKGVETNSGEISMTLPSGEVCKGRWSSIAPKTGSVTYGNLFTSYGSSAFGTSISTGIKPGVNKGQAYMTCNRGTTVESEFYTGSGTANGTGISKDSNGNVYKMIF